MSQACLVAYFERTWPHCTCYLRLSRNGSGVIVCWGHPLVTRYLSVIPLVFPKWTLISSSERSFHRKTWKTTRRLHCHSVSPHFGILTSHGIQTIQTLPGMSSSISTWFSCKCHGWNPDWIEFYYIHFLLKVLPPNGVNIHPHCNPFAQPPLPDLSLKQLQVLSFWVKPSKFDFHFQESICPMDPSQHHQACAQLDPCPIAYLGPALPCLRVPGWRGGCPGAHCGKHIEGGHLPRCSPPHAELQEERRGDFGNPLHLLACCNGLWSCHIQVKSQPLLSMTRQWQGQWNG